jgi:hypothetical protein
MCDATTAAESSDDLAKYSLGSKREHATVTTLHRNGGTGMGLDLGTISPGFAVSALYLFSLVVDVFQSRQNVVLVGSMRDDL